MVAMADKAKANSVRLEDVLKDKTNGTVVENPGVKKKKKKKDKNVMPKGARKSGRFWKNERDKPSNMNKTRGTKMANKFEKLMKLKEELKRIRTLTNNIVEAAKEEKEKKKERRRKNLKRREENRLKSEIVQVIKNPAKIKRMRKKQLRSIEKRDTLNM